ncbi:unnamed protein product [Allacma fusca]|uniref:Lipase domain-containing protein n=1 Tax=Allacma fusca TaxID=39272 RepID=A0A8J2KBL7_9HEXA|nr:unnamed protein product [Allacma fusca]
MWKNLCYWFCLINSILLGTLLLGQADDDYRVRNDENQVTRDRVGFISDGEIHIRNYIRFRLWTRKNSIYAQEIMVKNVKSLNTSYYDPGRLTKIFVGGLNNRADERRLSDYTAQLRDAYLRFGDVNFIVVDYGNLAWNVLYYTTVGGVVSRRLVDFLIFLEENNTDLFKVHLIGHSWGCHIAGNAARKLNSEIGRITGLDPAGPLYRFVPNQYRLDKSDAQFVDIVHSNGGASSIGIGGFLGITQPLGHVDFYPNGGSLQPGCPGGVLSFSENFRCSHRRALTYFQESITSPLAFPACRCNSWLELSTANCNCEISQVTFMGEHIPFDAEGMYYVRTKTEFPFGTGPAMEVVLRSTSDAPDSIKTESNLRTFANTTVLNVTTYTPEFYPNNDVLKACIAQF